MNALIEEGVDSNGDNLISTQEAKLISSLDISGNRDEGKSGEIKSLAGIEAFVNLDTLRCNQNKISGLDLSNNTSLTFLRCNDNQLNNLDLSACSSLIKL